MKLCNVDDHLELVTHGLDVVHARVAPQWVPAQVIDWCREKKAFLFIVDEGFFLLRPRHIPSINEVWVECLAAYGRTDSPESLITKYLPMVDQLVRDYGSHKLIFSSSRKAYIRMPEFSIYSITYERRVG